jgi:small subunit ribosomal protein S18
VRPTHHSSTNGSGVGSDSRGDARDSRGDTRDSRDSRNNPRRKKKRMLSRKKRSLDPSIVIDYKDGDLLRRFVTERGKIIPRRISGATQEQQRKLTTAIKRARFLGLLPYSVSHSSERGFAGEMQNSVQTFVSATMRGRGPGHHQRGPDAGGGGIGVSIGIGIPRDRDESDNDAGGDEEE